MIRFSVTVKGFAGDAIFEAANARAAKLAAWEAIKAAGYAYTEAEFMAIASARRAA
jgi:hypothetical protein